MTAKLVVTSSAALKFALPAWVAARVTVPAPVNVTVFPEMVAGPDLMERVIGKPEDAVRAPMLKEGSPKTWFGIGEKELMVCDARETTKPVVTSGAAFQFALPD